MRATHRPGFRVPLAATAWPPLHLPFARRHPHARNTLPDGTPAQTFERFSLSPGRRRKDRIARGAVVAATAVALVPLVLIVYYLLSKGLSSWSIKFFTTDPTGNTFFAASSIGGIKSAILGTIEMVALASAIAVPLGLGVAVWLVEYGKSSRFAHTVRFFIDVLTGVPSIMFGLFIYIA